MLLSEIPSFLTDSLGFDIEESGLLSVAPYFTNFCSVLLFAQVFEVLQVHFFNYYSIVIIIIIVVIITSLNY